MQDNNTETSYWMYITRIKDSNYEDLNKYLLDNGIESRPLFYPINTSEHFHIALAIISGILSVIILIGSLNKTPFGVVRYDINSVENFAEISIFLAPDFLGKGLGPFLLQKADNWLQTKRKKLTEIHAIVLAENKASHNMFIREVNKKGKVLYER